MFGLKMFNLPFLLGLIFCFGFPAFAREPQLIEVQVEVTEVDHGKASRIGVDWMDRVSARQNVPSSAFAFNAFEWVEGLKSTLHLLSEEGAAQLLANPNLTTNSGTQATFNAGGEIPYIVSTSLGSSHTEFKPYGVSITVEPTLSASGLITMDIKASVSSLDAANGVLLSGYTVPAISERQVHSHISIHPGTTVSLAGLVQSQDETVTRGIPVLKHLPLLGPLFRWKRKNYRRTSVVIFMTPRLVNL